MHKSIFYGRFSWMVGLAWLVLLGISISYADSKDDNSPQPRTTPELKMQGIALPMSWKSKPETTADTHTDAEWQAPSSRTVFGAVYLHVPPLMGGKELAKTVKNNYVKRQPDGKMSREWTEGDHEWFEADGAGTHTKGFVIAHGRHAWFLYYRYGTNGSSPQKEIETADRAINRVEPIGQ